MKFIIQVKCFKLDEGWDDNEDSPIHEEVWNGAIQFLIRYASYLNDHFGIVIDPPEVNPVSNGTVDLSWRTSNARMLINIRKESEELLAYFYGDLYKNKYPIKGIVPITDIQEYLALWMKNLV